MISRSGADHYVRAFISLSAVVPQLVTQSGFRHRCTFQNEETFLENPRFSVVIPIHNKGRHLHRSIASVLNQTFQDFELLLIDDASTDNSGEILLACTDSRIRCFTRTEPGPGGYAARNLGIENARAEWVAFLDADDTWSEGQLAEFNKLIEKYAEISIFTTSWSVRDAVGEIASSFRRSPEGSAERLFSLNDFLCFTMAGKSPICTDSVCIRRSVLLRANGFPAGKCKRGGDVDTWVRALVVCGRGVWSPYAGAIYFQDADNMVTRTISFSREVVSRTQEKHTLAWALKEVSDASTRKHLVQFVNDKIVRGWIQGIRDGANPGILPSVLVLRHLTMRMVVLAGVSLLPRPLLRLMYRGYKTAERSVASGK